MARLLAFSVDVMKSGVHDGGLGAEAGRRRVEG